jgi:colanic acid biosynthesis glycosyl transferase WcaI
MDDPMPPPKSKDNPPGGGGGKPPRLLFVNQYYWPDNASTAQLLADLAEDLASQGYECHIVCSRGGYAGQGADQQLPAYQVHNGVRIHRVAASAFGRKSIVGRMTDYLSYYASAMFKGLALPRCDAVVTLTTPPLIGLVGTVLKAIKRCKHVSWSMDLHPDASLALGKMKPGNPAVRILSWLGAHSYRRADRVVALGPYMGKRLLDKRVKPERLREIPVWSRRDEVYPIPIAGHPLRKELGLEGKFVAMYSGNLGLAHTFGEFIEAARRLRDDPRIVFLYVGSGPRLREVREAQEREGLANIRFMDYFPRDQLHHSLTIADVHLISMRPEMTGIVVPGKLYGIMASGRPAPLRRARSLRDRGDPPLGRLRAGLPPGRR